MNDTKVLLVKSFIISNNNGISKMGLISIVARVMFRGSGPVNIYGNKDSLLGDAVKPCLHLLIGAVQKLYHAPRGGGVSE